MARRRSQTQLQARSNQTPYSSHPPTQVINHLRYAKPLRQQDSRQGTEEEDEDLSSHDQPLSISARSLFISLSASHTDTV